MIDLHCHMLPAVDDGSQTIDMSLKMAEQARTEGVKKILLTPHHKDGEFVNHKDKVMLSVKNFQKDLSDNDINIEVRAGQEVHLNGNLLSDVQNDDILYADNYGKYLMLELPHSYVPEYTNNIIFELKLKGITPVIVHPERNNGFQNDPTKLYDLVKQGCLTQLTATSYVGGFGKKIQKFTDKIIDAGLGFTFSSDAHNLSGRKFRMDEAYELLMRKKGSNIANYYKENAEKIWNGEDIEVSNIKHVKNEGIFSFFLRS